MKIKINRQKVISFAIAYMVSFLGLLNCVNAITNEIGINTAMDTFFMYMLLWGLALFVWLDSINKRNLKKDVLFITILLILLHMWTLLFFQENTKYILASTYTFSNSPLLVLFVYSFSGYVAVRSLNNYQYLLKYLKIFSYVIIIMSSIVFWGIEDSFAKQYMTLSYNMLLQVSYLIIFKPKEKKLLNVIIIGMGISIIVIGGARGALLGLIVVILFEILGIDKVGISLKKIFALSTLMVIGSVFYMYYEQILLMLIKVIAKLELKSRTLELLLYSEGDVSSGRVELLSELFENINLIGHGLYGDRVILNGIYAHNLFVDWIVDFGLFIGIVLSVLCIVLLILGFLKGDNISRKIIIVFIPNGIVSLMLSGSYLGQQPAFYVLLGVCVNQLFLVRKQSNNYLRQM